ncbi:MAG: pyruvate kinase [Candidatus Atribacteria bacterium]|nr:pyruvate kinase [Candidatus Atribacteria bacterium]
MFKVRRTKIICTLGPSSGKREIIREMLRAGMNVARLNFSHGEISWHRAMAEMLRKEAHALSSSIGILQDLQGVKIRIGEVEGEQIELREGEVVAISAGDSPTTASHIYIRYDKLLEDIREGEILLFDDGNIQLQVTEKTPSKLIAQVLNGGWLRSRKGVSFPQTRTSVRTFTEKDKRDLLEGAKMGVDYVAISFVKDAEDILRVKTWMEENHLSPIPLIAKIEKHEAIRAIEDICDVAEGVMIARGDLGVETSLDMVPVYQKKLMDTANKKGRIVIVATQMLESMRESPRPTRAEVTDVANAVLDGADALMLSAETATGRYPVEATRMMHTLIANAEEHFFFRIPVVYEPRGIFPEAIVAGAVRTACDIQAKAIVVFTQSGFTAFLLSQLRPPVPVVALTPDSGTFYRLSMIWGVSPRMLPQEIRVDDLSCLRVAETMLLQEHLVHSGDPVVFVASSPFLGSGNLIRLHRIGDPI